ncbi:MAG: PLP-dependent aminotransferase family protein [Candidatus Glassbacteria bacterium]|nr:PLP-dependent aminotransferase family protein [Candidatus Glassbacteria bacterium]
MDYTELFSQGGSRLTSSKIRELMKLAADPEIISMAGGMPDARHFPFREIREIEDGWTDSQRAAAYQYGPTSGYPPLVEQIAAYEANGGIDMSDQRVLPTSGAQQAIQLLTRIFCDPGDTILVEIPTFIGAVAVFIGYGADPAGVRMDDRGIIPEVLEERIGQFIAAGRRPKFLYTNPTFQNPGGVTLPQSRRDSVYEICARHGVPIVEDDPYHDLYFEGGHGDYRSIKARDSESRVVRVGTSSKILSPGIRLGWMVGAPEVVSRCETAKQGEDACSSSYSQVLAASYFAGGYVGPYTEKMRKIYGAKCSLMLECLEREMPDGVSWTRPAGGFFTWVTLPEGSDSEKLFLAAIAKKVAFVTGAPFHVDGLGGNKLRLAFSNSSHEQIEEGIRRLGEAVREVV